MDQRQIATVGMTRWDALGRPPWHHAYDAADWPELIEAPNCWLAFGDDPAIGVMASTREEVIAEFQRSRARWLELRRQVETEDPIRD